MGDWGSGLRGSGSKIPETVVIGRHGVWGLHFRRLAGLKV